MDGSLTAHAPTDTLTARVGDYRDRIARLSDKLCVLHEGLDHDRNTRFEYLQGKMRQLDERLTASQDSGAKKISVLKQQLIAVHHDLTKNVRIAYPWNKQNTMRSLKLTRLCRQR